MRQALILVGGKGTRLGDLARHAPKPLLSIAGQTRFLDYNLVNLARHGVRDIVLLAGYMGDITRQTYDGARILGSRVRVIVESEPAGTAGALRNAGGLDDVFLLLNGDSLADVNFLTLSRALQPGDVGALALRQVPDGARYGRVALEGDRIRSFQEKNTAFDGPALISVGVYALRRSVLDTIAATPCSIELDVFPKLAKAGVLAGMVVQCDFIDIGLPETLAEARATFPQRMRRKAILFDRDGTLIKDNGYTHRVEDLVWQPGAIEAVRMVNDSGALAIVVTNQSGIARGLYGEAELERFHKHMQDELRVHGAHIDAFYYCPYHPDGTIANLALADHPDRKPNPGMLRRALIEWNADPQRSFMVGDTVLDTTAADTLGLPSRQVEPGELLSAVAQGLAMAGRQTGTTESAMETLKTQSALAKTWLFDHALPLWWARGYDRDAQCFHERLALDGAPVASLPRRVRVQARQTAVYARAGRLGWSGPWRDAVEAGVSVLRQRCLRADGGTRHLLSPGGAPMDERRDLYDLAFVAFAFAEAAAALGGRDDLIDEAEALVDWAERNWADAAAGGFAEGDVTPTPPRRQNPHMHLFEALLTLHEATSDERYLTRADRLAELFATKLFDAKYVALPEYYEPDWRQRAGEEGRIVEPGHHFEWSWLLHRWGERRNDRLAEQAERLRIHAEVYGVDPSTGAIFDELHIDGRARARTSRLWPHTERIKANIVRFERTRDLTAGEAAAQAFDTLMRYCDTPIKGLWRDRLDANGAFVEEAAPASSFYHIMIALFELCRVVDGLEAPGEMGG